MSNIWLEVRRQETGDRRQEIIFIYSSHTPHSTSPHSTSPHSPCPPDVGGVGGVTPHTPFSIIVLPRRVNHGR
ncbi:MAG: hypothetical protein ACK48H_03375 [Microcystis sp.]|uniref:hypothetical protein n=1 Tax=Microcystis sp. TaxID=1127 RepID=UPI00391C3A25